MNINKKILSFLLAVMMIISLTPVFAAEEVAAVDLIHDANGKLRDGVFITGNGSERLADQKTDYLFVKAVDGSTGTQWLSNKSSAWIQVNFPVAQKLTEVVVYGSSSDGFNHLFKVLASNDPTFATSVTLLDQTASYSGGSFTINDASLLSDSFRYVRVTASGATRLGIREIKINGYLESLPVISGVTDLTKRADVSAKVSTENEEAYKAQQVFDGKTETGYADTTTSSPELVLDLKRESIIDMVEFTPLSGNENYRKNYEIHASNSPTFDSYDVIYTHLRGLAATADGATIKCYGVTDTAYRYVRIKSNTTTYGNDALGVAELKVWGTEADNGYEFFNMTGASFVTATSGESVANIVDGDASTAYKSAAEETKSAVIFDLEGAMTAQSAALVPATSIMLLPIYADENEEIRTNFNIYGSVTGDFTDAVLIGSVGATPILATSYHTVDIKNIDLYKKIKIEKAEVPSAAESLGFYEVKIIHDSLDDDYAMYLAQAKIKECLSDFKNFPESLTMEQLLAKWTSDDPDAELHYIKTGDLLDEVLGDLPAEYDKAFEYLCELYDKDGKMSEISDIAECLNAAYIMAMYETSNTAAVEKALQEYKGDINGLYDRVFTEDEEGNVVEITEIIDVTRYSAVYTALKSNIKDAESFKNVMEWTLPLSLIQGGTKADVRYAIENYNDVLGCDLSYAADNNVTIAQILEKIDRTNGVQYYNNFNIAYKAAVDAVIAENGEEPDEEETDPGQSSIVSPGVGSIGTRPSGNTSVGNKEEKPKDDEDNKKEEPLPETPETPTESEKPLEKVTFNDISGITWARDYIESLATKGIINGDGNGNFNPNRSVTREEFLKMLIEALKINVSTNEITEFADCDTGAWYYPYIQIASSNKMVNGIDRKNFGIGKNITRQDMAVLLSKALAIKNITAIESEFVFADENEISDYAKSDVSKMYSLGMISGVGDDLFAPKAYTTRAQAAVIIGRALEKMGGASN